MRSPLPGPVARARASLARIQRARECCGKWPVTKAEWYLSTVVMAPINDRDLGEKPSRRMLRLRQNAELRAARAARAWAASQ